MLSAPVPVYASSCRRSSEPLVCQQLWDAITVIRNHKQLPSFDRIRRYMTRTYNMEVPDIERHLEECASDNLIAITRKMGQKGSKVGVEQEGFRLPMPPEEPARHDWYCFECHHGGDVLSCSKCYRVYHQRCVLPHVLQQSALLHHQQLMQLQQQQQQAADGNVAASTAAAAAAATLMMEPQFVCGICQKRMLARAAAKNGLSREELNALLAFTVHRLRDRLPANLMERSVPPVGQKPGVEGTTGSNPNSSAPHPNAVQPPSSSPGGSTSASSTAPSVLNNNSSSNSNGSNTANLHSNFGSEPWRAQLLLHHHMDVPTMERKTHDNRYRTAADLEIDAMTIVHNVCIYHGPKSSLAENARLFLRECQHCLLELQLCSDCYRWQYCSDDPLWFCKPCNPPHRLVYAKQKGFPYWPAKVIREGPSSCDVRFFGSQHQRANIDNSLIKPISSNAQMLQIKKTSAYTKAMEELKQHQSQLVDGGASASLLPPPPPPQQQEMQQQQQPRAPKLNRQEEDDKNSSSPARQSTAAAHMSRADWEEHQQQLQHQFQQQQLQQQQQQFHPSYIASAALHQQYQAASLATQQQKQPPHSGTSTDARPATPHQSRTDQASVASSDSGGRKEKSPSKQKTSEEKSDSKLSNCEERDEEEEEDDEEEEEEQEDEVEEREEGAGREERERGDGREDSASEGEDTKRGNEAPAARSPVSSSFKSSEQKSGSSADACGRDDVVSSSSQEPTKRSLSVQTPQHLLQAALEELESQHEEKESNGCGSPTITRLLDQIRSETTSAGNKNRSVGATLRKVEREFERLKEEYRAKLATLEETHKQHIRDTKRKQWCWTCESEAIYHCCWNTAYCSTDCQQQHWHKEHKKLCRRKR